MRVVALPPPYNLYVNSHRFGVTFCCYSGNSAGQVRTAALAGDLICETLPAAKAVRNYVEIVGRRSRYHSPFVSHRCDKSTGTSYPPRVATFSPGGPMCSVPPLCHTRELRTMICKTCFFTNHGTILLPSLFPLLTDIPPKQSTLSDSKGPLAFRNKPSHGTRGAPVARWSRATEEADLG